RSFAARGPAGRPSGLAEPERRPRAAASVIVAPFSYEETPASSGFADGALKQGSRVVGMCSSLMHDTAGVPLVAQPIDGGATSFFTPSISAALTGCTRRRQ
ncbi:unnamed protein product, partial [Amoebophrya sp. A120]